jgi:hypothetical protein
MHLIPFARQWQRVGASGSAHVEHDRRWGRQEAAEQLAGSHALQPRPGLQAIPLGVVPVMGSNRWVKLRCHARTLSPAAEAAS